MLDLRRARQLLALAEHRNFARAAAALHMSQPALTRSIQSVEHALGGPLFDRGRRNTEPTALGQLVLEHARRLEVAARDLNRDVQLARGLELGELTIGVGPWGGLVMAGPPLGRLCRRYPRLRTRLLIPPWQELPACLRRREADLMVANLLLVRDEPGFETLPLAPHPEFVVCRAGHPLTKRRAPTREDLYRFPLAGANLTPAQAAKVGPARPAGGPSARRPEELLTVTCDSSAILKTVLLESDAVSLMSPFMVADEIRSGALTFLRGIDMESGTHFGVAWIKGRSMSAPAKAFLDLIVEHDRELVAEERALLASFGRRRSRRRGSSRVAR